MTAPAASVVLCGGSEVLSVTLAMELLGHGNRVLAIGLGREPVLRAQAGICTALLDWPPQDAADAACALRDLVTAQGFTGATVFASEDSGAQLLFSQWVHLAPVLRASSRCRLRHGGLDKAELFEALATVPALARDLAPTVVIDRPEALASAFHQLGGTVLVGKPALKPFSMQLTGLEAKTLTCRRDTLGHDIAALRRAWPCSERWVVQPLLRRPPEGEAVWWGFRRADGQLVGTTGYERLKSPREGGTACIVETWPVPAIEAKSQRILAALEFQGLAELAYLQDGSGEWRLLELNPRPWLNIGLTATAGLPLVAGWQQHADRPASPASALQARQGVRWVSVERLLLAAWRGELGSRLQGLCTVLMELRRARHYALFSVAGVGVLARWLAGSVLRRLRRPLP